MDSLELNKIKDLEEENRGINKIQDLLYGSTKILEDVNAIPKVPRERELQDAPPKELFKIRFHDFTTHSRDNVFRKLNDY